jgi:hypothetical protein
MIIRTEGILAAEGPLRDVAGNGTVTRVQLGLQYLPQSEREFSRHLSPSALFLNLPHMTTH